MNISERPSLAEKMQRSTASVTLSFVEQLAREAGEMMKEHFWERNKTVESKESPSDLVTETDKAIECYLKKKIHAAFPTHAFLCEESSAADQRLTDDPTWIIDPIDGTNNFVHTLPYTCVSIGYAVKQEVLIGVVYAPMLNELFSAEKGNGARLNGVSISTSGCVDISSALVSCGLNVKVIQKITLSGVDEAAKAAAAAVKDAILNNLLYCVHHCRDIRHLGSTALELCYIAAGRLDALQSIGPKEWDMAAGLIMVREAGGCVVDLDGTELKLHEERILAGSTRALTSALGQHLTFPTHS